MSDFVKVSGGRLTLGDRPFYFVGANSYDLMILASTGQRANVTELLDICANMGLSVIRTWAFFDGPGGLQTAPGVLSENYLEGLDFVIAEIGKRGMKVLPVLINYWRDYGGMFQYAKWALGTEPSKTEDFYSCSGAVQMFMDYMTAIISRTNSITGIAYKDDPAIMAWSIANEPRCKGDESCCVLEGFLRAACKHAKSLDGNHLVTHGAEGFYGPTTPDLMKENPYNTAEEGTDFYDNYDIPEADFTCAHLWPDNWGVDSRGQEEEAEFTDLWIKRHSQLSSRLGKPYVLTEFGKRLNGLGRVAHFNKVFDVGYRLAEAGPPMMGAMFWNFALAPVGVTVPRVDYEVLALRSASGSENPPFKTPEEFNEMVNEAVVQAAARFNALRTQNVTPRFGRGIFESDMN